MKKSRGNKMFTVFLAAIMILIAIIILYPIWYVFIASISNPMRVADGSVVIWPVGFELSSYKKVFGMEYIWSSFGNTFFYSFAGTAINLALTILGAYPLSKRRLPFRGWFTLIIMLPMWFNAGMMPTFLNYRELGLYDSRLAILLCGAVSAFNLIMLRTAFENVPMEMEESAKMDGANDWTVLTRIYLPLAKSSLITVGMYYFVNRWNGYFWAMLLLKNQKKLPLQVFLKNLIVEVANSTTEMIDISTQTINQQTMIYATIIVSILPIMIIYPLCQKYFSKGAMIGAIKG